jgi:hypothetical protein
MAIHKGYTGAGSCTQGPQTGARGFMSWYLAKYSGIGGQNSGIYNCRNVSGSSTATSIHGEGRAVDLGLKFVRGEFWTLANLLRAHSKELGIQCIIYNRKIWSGGYKNTGFQRYTGVNPHTDHLHVEMAWWSAQMSADDYVALIEKTIGHKVGGGNVVPAKAPTKAPAKAATVTQNSGNSKADNKAIANLLNNLGYRAGVPDGVPGTYLRDGAKAYQKAQTYFPGMKADGDWGAMTQAHYEWVRDHLQPAVAKWEASQRLGKLIADGDHAKVTKRHIVAVMKANGGKGGAYYKAGGRVADGIPGPVFCKMLKIPNHPSA